MKRIRVVQRYGSISKNHKWDQIKNTVIKLLAVFAFLLGAVGVPALAAPPANDLFDGATPVGLGFSETLDTTEATTDDDDAQLNAGCGAPATDASVWYALEGSDTGVVVDVLQSDYPAVVLVGELIEGNLEFVACGYSSVNFFAAAGKTYYVLAIDPQYDGSGNGGLLNISFNGAPTLDIDLNPVGQVNARTGVATISGVYTCTDGSFILGFGDVRQKVGRFTIIGFYDFFDFGTCDGLPHAWAAEVFPQNGKFAGGKAMAVTSAFSCGIFECADGIVEQTIQLRGGRK